MTRFFAMDGKLNRMLTRIADLVILNLIWLLSCLPIVTIGAATTSLYYVTLKMASNEEEYILKSYFRFFKENFGQSTIVWMLMLVCGAVLYFDFYFSSHADAAGARLTFIPLFLAALLILLAVCYMFPVLAYFQNSMKKLIKNSFLLALAHLPKSILLLLSTAVPVLLLAAGREQIIIVLFVLVLVGGSGVAFVNSCILRTIFVKYVPEEQKGKTGRK